MNANDNGRCLVDARNIEKLTRNLAARGGDRDHQRDAIGDVTPELKSRAYAGIGLQRRRGGMRERLVLLDSPDDDESLILERAEVRLAFPQQLGA